MQLLFLNFHYKFSHFFLFYFHQASKFMKFLRENHGIYPLLSVYNCFLGACAKMKSIIHVNQCLDMMELQRVGKNEITYSELLKVCRNSVDLEFFFLFIVGLYY